jgi:hypothetical protein
MQSTPSLLLFISLILLSVTGCEKYIDFDDEIKKPKIVVNAKINSDSIFQVHLSKSLSVIDNAELTPITDGNIDIYDNNDQFIETLIHQTDGYYRGSFIPSANSTYHIKVSAPSYDPVSSTTFIPPSVPIVQVDTSSFTNEDGNRNLRLKITIQDDGSSKNYYQLQVGYAQEFSGIVYSYPEYFGSSDLSLDLGQQTTDLASFTDELFNGSQKSIEIFFYDNREYYDYLLITLTSASKDVYLYDRTTQAFGQTQGNPFAEPVQVYNNILGGFGIFGGYQNTRYKLNF